MPATQSNDGAACLVPPTAPTNGTHDTSTAVSLIAALATGDVLAIARAYRAVGLSPYPVRADGSKAACEKGWTEFCHRLPTDDELQRGFDAHRGPRGIANACGPASNLLVFDHERWDAFTHWGARLSPEERNWLNRCPVVRTPSGGAHVYLRLTEAVKGHVYARTAEGKCLIESRGTGHGAIAPGSPPSCHPSGNPYRLARPGWLDGEPFDPIPLWVFNGMTVHAAELNEYVKPRPREVVGDRQTPSGEVGDRPGDHFNGRAAWGEILCPHGWTVYQVTQGATYWTRPGKRNPGVSASTGHCRGPSGNDLLHVFSTSAVPFDADGNYSRFGAYALLNHGGDFVAATRALGLAGYGVPARKAVRA